MSRPRLELADIFRRHGPAYRIAHRVRMTSIMVKVMRAIELCRTAALGGHVERCDDCGHIESVAYNSCRNRHCPKCQFTARTKWVEARLRELLPVPYFHVVFTIPACLAVVAFYNKRVVYNLLFRTVSQTLLQIAENPKHLGAQVGFLAVLHTWGQNLSHHPHVHCIVPGGGLSPDGRRWIHRRKVKRQRKKHRKPFFLPEKVLACRFRTLFLEGLKSSFDNDQLAFPQPIAHLASRTAFLTLLQSTRTVDWVVYAKPPFGGPEQVLKYLGAYTHRVAISNHRLLSLENGKVTFRLRKRRQGGGSPTMTLTADEFIRRFLLHVLPEGFVRIRHYGLLANCHRKEKLARCRELLGASPPSPSPVEPKVESEPSAPESRPCPRCRKGHLFWVEIPQGSVDTSPIAADSS